VTATTESNPSHASLDRRVNASDPLHLVNLAPIMQHTNGRPEIVIGLIDGPIAVDHPDFSGANIRGVADKCVYPKSFACSHGTFVAGILSARRDSDAPGICPKCTLLNRPIFAETVSAGEWIPSATPEELAAGIVECVTGGARLVNVSAALMTTPSVKGERALADALDHAARRGVIVVAAAGNQGTVGSTMITRHPWVIPVVACDRRGRPLNESNVGSSIGRRGLSAPGEAITSLGTNGKSTVSGGTSVAAPFVTGAIALVWSEFPNASGSELRMAVAHSHSQKRPTVVPPLLNALSIHKALAMLSSRRTLR
jgi:subtilisin family serine protease